MRKTLIAVGLAAVLGAGLSATASAKDSFTIGLSNGWVGSEWRTQMIDEAETAAKAWEKKGIKVKTIAQSANVDVPGQIAQVRNFINQGVDAIIVNPKFAAEKPEAVKGFLRAFLKGLKDTVKDPTSAVDSVIRRNDVAKKDVELERLQMALKDNILTPEVKANGFGNVVPARLDAAIDQIGLTFNFKAKPKAGDIFDPSFLPPNADRLMN